MLKRICSLLALLEEDADEGDDEAGGCCGGDWFSRPDVPFAAAAAAAAAANESIICCDGDEVDAAPIASMCCGPSSSNMELFKLPMPFLPLALQLEPALATGMLPLILCLGLRLALPFAEPGKLLPPLSMG